MSENELCVSAQVLDDTDRRVLQLLQQDLDIPRQDMAKAVGMSPSTLWRRVTELAKLGIIRKRVALLDPLRAGVPVCVFLSVNLTDHDKSTRKAFEAFVSKTPEIMECYAVTGGFDYVLIVRMKSIAAFEFFLMERVLGHESVASASSQISLRQHKYSTELPI